jgi:hypothetical protein
MTRVTMEWRDLGGDEMFTERFAPNRRGKPDTESNQLLIDPKMWRWSLPLQGDQTVKLFPGFENRGDSRFESRRREVNLEFR